MCGTHNNQADGEMPLCGNTADPCVSNAVACHMTVPSLVPSRVMTTGFAQNKERSIPVLITVACPALLVWIFTDTCLCDWWNTVAVVP